MWGLYEGLRRPLAKSNPSSGFSLASLQAASTSARKWAESATSPNQSATLDPKVNGSSNSNTSTNSTSTSSASTTTSPNRNPTLKLRINTILNSMTSRGTFVGNSAGVLGKHFALNLKPAPARC